MPVVQAYQGSYSIHAHAKNDMETEIFAKEIICYGMTIGELLDNLVSASVEIANEAFEWCLGHRGSGYTLSDDYWFSTFSYPDINYFIYPNRSGGLTDVAGGSRVKEIEYIVYDAIIQRDITISSFLNHAKFKKRRSRFKASEQAKHILLNFE